MLLFRKNLQLQSSDYNDSTTLYTEVTGCSQTLGQTNQALNPGYVCTGIDMIMRNRGMEGPGLCCHKQWKQALLSRQVEQESAVTDIFRISLFRPSCNESLFGAFSHDRWRMFRAIILPLHDTCATRSRLSAYPPTQLI
jgi:hypothetical protein